MYYIYHARFQPLTKLHERELMWLVNNIKSDDKVIIGIIKYEPESIAGKKDLERFRLQFNLLTYWERVNQINYFINSNNLQDKIPYIIPLPRPSQKLEKANYFLPSRNERKMCINEMDVGIGEALMELGENICEIPSFDSELMIISSELIYSLMALGNDSWKQMVNQEICRQLLEINFIDRIHNWIDDKDANDKLEKIIANTTNTDEKELLKKIKENCYEMKNDFSNNISNAAVTDSIEQLYDNELTSYRKDRNSLAGRDATGFTKVRYDSKISCFDSIIELLEVLKAKDISLIPKHNISEKEFKDIKDNSNKKINELKDALSECLTSMNAVSEGDSTQISVNASVFKNLMEKNKSI